MGHERGVGQSHGPAGGWMTDFGRARRAKSGHANGGQVHRLHKPREVREVYQKDLCRRDRVLHSQSTALRTTECRRPDAQVRQALYLFQLLLGKPRWLIRSFLALASFCAIAPLLVLANHAQLNWQPAVKLKACLLQCEFLNVT